MVGDSINVYFADALQPIKFVTADSLDSEFGEVLIRVGTDTSGYNRPVGGDNGEKERIKTEQTNGIDTLRAGFEKMLEEKKAAEKIIKQFYDAALEKDTKISSGDGNEEKMLGFEREEIHKKVIDEYLQP